MSLTVGIIGLPNVGKSTLFNAITKKGILASNYPFATIDPNIGMVNVPDKRLEILERMYLPKELGPASFKFIDIAGLVKGASLGEGLGNKFLSHIREVDAICEVIRCFDDEQIIHVENEVDPIRDIEIINLELILADLELVTNRIKKIEKKAKTTKDKQTIEELALLNRIFDALKQNIPSISLVYNENELKILKSFKLLTLKPIIYLANVDEEHIIKDNHYLKLVKEYANKQSNLVIKMCVKIESELSELNDLDKSLFLTALKIKESSLDLLIRASFSLLGLATYFTCGDKEVKAWTFKKGMTASECAGLIHSDFERGFIRAEVISYDDLITYGSEKVVKEMGKARLEGKEYLMRDGDICHFRFNV